MMKNKNDTRKSSKIKYNEMKKNEEHENKSK